MAFFGIRQRLTLLLPLGTDDGEMAITAFYKVHVQGEVLCRGCFSLVPDDWR